MAPSKNPSRRQRILEKREMLGSFVVLAFVTFGAIVATYYLDKANVDLFRTALASLFIAGILVVFIEMRGEMGKKISGIRARRKIRRLAGE